MKGETIALHTYANPLSLPDIPFGTVCTPPGCCGRCADTKTTACQAVVFAL